MTTSVYSAAGSIAIFILCMLPVSAFLIFLFIFLFILW